MWTVVGDSTDPSLVKITDGTNTLEIDTRGAVTITSSQITELANTAIEIRNGILLLLNILDINSEYSQEDLQGE